MIARLMKYYKLNNYDKIFIFVGKLANESQGAGIGARIYYYYILIINIYLLKMYNLDRFLVRSIFNMNIKDYVVYVEF